MCKVQSSQHRGSVQSEAERGYDASQSEERVHGTRVDGIGVTDQISLQRTSNAVHRRSLEAVGDEGKLQGHHPAGGEFTLRVQQIKMSACWMFVILMGCRLGPSHSTQTPSTCACHDQLETICASPGDTVTVPCPKLDANHVIFKLLQDEEMIYNRSYVREKKALSHKPTHNGVGVELRENKDNSSVSFWLTGVNNSSHGIYRCEGTVIYPPPLKTVSSHWRVLVLLEGHQCCSNARSPGPNCGFHWIWILILVSIYSIIATIIAVVIWVKLRRTDSQSDYMNTKPKAPRERRKKRGVQNPIPRHF